MKSEITGFNHKYNCKCFRCNYKAWKKIKPDVSKLESYHTPSYSEYDDEFQFHQT